MNPIRYGGQKKQGFVFATRFKFKNSNKRLATESQACNFAELSLLQLILCGDAV
jgi:hypothetical protein